MTVTRKTIAKDVLFRGLALHAGEPTTAIVRPGEEGIIFNFGEQKIAAVPENVTHTSRCTCLGPVSTIEHMMSAFAALGITDVEVELTYPELPALDGSSQEYFLAFDQAGLEEIGQLEIPTLFKRVFVEEGGAKIAIAAGSGRWRYELTPRYDWMGEQNFETENVTEGYRADIAPARTWAYEDEIDYLRSNGFGRGLTLDSAVVIQETQYLNKPKFPTEPSRHKLLDLVGDLYLAGYPIHALSVTGVGSGHRLNVQAAAAIRAHLGT